MSSDVDQSNLPGTDVISAIIIFNTGHNYHNYSTGVILAPNPKKPLKKFSIFNK